MSGDAKPRPGASLEDDGVRFGLVSRHAEAVDICLFDGEGRERRQPMSRGADDLWEARVPDLGAGATTASGSMDAGMPRAATTSTRPSFWPIPTRCA